jgi:hypothetical protein
MQLHFVIDHDCELKSRGEEAFLRGITPYAIWRDLEDGVDSFGDHQSVVAAQKAVAGAPRPREVIDTSTASLEGAYVTLPRMARRENDPVSGRVSAAQLLARARRAVDRAMACRRCPAAAANPERFGCWAMLALPANQSLSHWVLERWKRGRAEGGREDLVRLCRLHGKRGAAYRRLFPPSARNEPGRARRRAWHVEDGRREELSLDALFAFLVRVGTLEPGKHLIPILRDFQAMAPEALSRLEDFRRLAPYAPATWEAAPFAIQPAADDGPGILSFKSFLHVCYWGAHMGRRVSTHGVSLEFNMDESVA